MCAPKQVFISHFKCHYRAQECFQKIAFVVCIPRSSMKSSVCNFEAETLFLKEAPLPTYWLMLCKIICHTEQTESHNSYNWMNRMNLKRQEAGLVMHYSWMAKLIPEAGNRGRMYNLQLFYSPKILTPVTHLLHMISLFKQCPERGFSVIRYFCIVSLKTGAVTNKCILFCCNKQLLLNRK